MVKLFACLTHTFNGKCFCKPNVFVYSVGLSRILAVVGRELDQEHGRLAASHKRAESSFHAAKDEQQRYEAALSSIDPLLTQTLDKVKVAAKTSEHKCRVADAQEELDKFSAQLEGQLSKMLSLRGYKRSLQTGLHT